MPVTLITEIAFEANFNEYPGYGNTYQDSYQDVYSPGWTDVSDYVESASIKRGRQRELDQMAAGTGSVLLDNRDRRFDPTNTSSPYWPNVIPNKRIRIRGDDNGTVHPILEGFIDAWPIQWQKETAWVEVPITDGFKTLNLIDLPDSVYVGEVLTDSPMGFWRLNESQSDVPVTDASGNENPGIFQGSPTMSQSDPITDGQDGAILFTGGGDYLDLGTGAAISGTGAFTAEFWIRDLTTNNRIIFTQGLRSFGSAGTTYFTIYKEGSNLKFTLSGVTLTTTLDTAWHHIACVRESGGTLRLYKDGVLITSGAQASTSLDLASILIAKDTTATFNGYLDEIAMYHTALSATRITAHYNARNAWLNDRSGARVTRILDFAGWPTADRVIDTGQAQLQSEPDLGGSALEHIKKVTESEFGNGYVRKDGKFRFRERHALLRTPYTTSQGTFSDEMESALVLTGAESASASSLTFALTGDLDLRWRGSLNDWTPTTAPLLVDKLGTNTGYQLKVNPAGTLSLLWGTGTATNTRTSTAATGLTDGSIKWVRAVLDIDNGAVGHDVKFYLSDDGTTWTQLGTTITTAVITLVAANTNALITGTSLVGRVSKVIVRSGIDGSIVASPDFNRDRTSSFLDAQGNTWTMNGTAWFFEDLFFGYRFESLEIDYSELQIKNDVTTQREGGVPQYAEDQASKNKYGTRSWSKTGLLNNTDAPVSDAAQYVVNKSKEPILEVTQVKLNPAADSSLWGQVLGRELEDRITVKATPPGGGPIISKQLHIQGISHEIGPGPAWITNLDTSEADAVTSYWQIGVPGRSELGSTTKLTF